MSILPCLPAISARLSFILAICGLILLTATPAAAQNDCAQMHPNDSGERIKCMFGNLIAQQEITAEMAGQLPHMSMNASQRLKNEMARTARSMARTPGPDFRELTKKKRSTCQIAEIIGDGKGDDDGICKRGSEDCLEVVGDQIGDDIQPCQLTGPPSGRETCVEICDPDAINAQDDNFDDDPSQDSLGRDMEEMLDDLTEEFVELNQMLGEEMRLRAAVRKLAIDPDDDCDVAISALFARRNVNLLAALLGAATGAKGAADICAPVAQLDISGFNAAPVCAIPEGIAFAAVLIANAFLFEDAANDSDRIDATLACVNGLDGAAEQTEMQLTDVQNRLMAVESRLMTVQSQLETTLQLLNTPQGRRGDFPEK